MKKSYIQPQSKVYRVKVAGMVCASGDANVYNQSATEGGTALGRGNSGDLWSSNSDDDDQSTGW